MLRVRPVGVDRSVASRWQAQQVGSERGADASAARRRRILPRPVAVEIELRLHADPAIGLLQRPVFGAIAQVMVALAVDQRGRPGVIRVALIRAALCRTKIAAEARDPRERGFD